MPQRHAPFVAALLGLAIAGCGGAARDSTTSDADAPLLILAAASTTDPIEELAAAFEAETGTAVRVTTGASNALARQLVAGVPGDLFLSANAEWAEAVEREGLAVESRPLLGNRLVIVTPRGNPAGIASPGDLLGERVQRIALAGEKVPAGLYAEQALRHAGVLAGLVENNRIARGQNVRLTLGFVETGEAEAGIVYATDARASQKVDVVHTFPPEAHAAIVYPLVLLKSPRSDGAGRRFLDFLFTSAATAVFERHGFSPISVVPR
jgi:molybdate transport system substrate-binding protein